MADDQHVSTHRARVNGSMLSQFHGKPVCVIGSVVRADGGGTAFQMKTSDDNAITVRLKNPISEPLSGLIEVYGIGQGKSLIVADSFTCIADRVAANFDMKTYNDAVKLLHSVQGDINPWIPT